MENRSIESISRGVGFDLRFRIWDEESKTFVKGKVCDDGTLLKDGETKTRKTLLLSVSTTYKDMNGEELFQGDIVEVLFQNEKRYCVINCSPEREFYLDNKSDLNYEGEFVQLRPENTGAFLEDDLKNPEIDSDALQKVGSIYENREWVHQDDQGLNEANEDAIREAHLYKRLRKSY